MGVSLLTYQVGIILLIPRAAIIKSESARRVGFQCLAKSKDSGNRCSLQYVRAQPGHPFSPFLYSLSTNVAALPPDAIGHFLPWLPKHLYVRDGVVQDINHFPLAFPLALPSPLYKPPLILYQHLRRRMWQQKTQKSGDCSWLFGF